jgi:AmmeMemoRadiSam system protein B
MDLKLRPKARMLEPIPLEIKNQQVIALRDPLGFSDDVVVTPYLYFFLAHCDGRRAIADLRLVFTRRFQHILTDDEVQQMLAEMDRHYLLEGEHFEERRRAVLDAYRRETVREAAHVGRAYPAEPEALRKQLDSYYANGASSTPGPAPAGDRRLAAFVAPHISVQLGADCFAAAYRRVRQSPPADTYVILGTGHAHIESVFAATRKDFATPLGTAKTDAAFIDSLEKQFDGDLCKDEIHHRGEHVIEFQLIFLQHALPDRDFRIVPILCSYSPEQLADGVATEAKETVARFGRALRAAIDESDRSVCLISSADLAHIGFRYGDPKVLERADCESLEREDRTMLETICAGDPRQFAEHLIAEDNRRRICGFPCIHTMLSARDLAGGELLGYGQSAMDERNSTVSYASIAYYQQADGHSI